MRAYIGLGSNLADPIDQVKTAISNLQSLPDSQLITWSALYASPPMGPQDQPDYINAVVEVETALSAHQLLDALQGIEQQQGRIRKRHWGERTLDLDVLLYGQNEIDDERLQIPHPGISLRAFVLYPLAEVAPDLNIPQAGKIAQLLQHCPRDGLRKLEKILL
jgi:2-amino-4-hydroxy-6-hydroxymethyldihydropteridine diphosphokinase